MLKVPEQVVENLDSDEPFEIPQYTYQAVPSKDAQKALISQESVLQFKKQEEERLREELRTLKEKTEKDEQTKIIQNDIHKIQMRKKEVSNIIKKDMREQSENIRKRLAMRNKRRVSSMQRLDIAGVNLSQISASKGKEKSFKGTEEKKKEANEGPPAEGDQK